MSAQTRGARRTPTQPRSLNSNTTVSLSATPSCVSIPLSYGPLVAATAPIILQILVTNPASTEVDIYAYFASSTAALTGAASGRQVPSSDMYGWTPGGVTSTFTAFTQSAPVGTAGASLHLFSANAGGGTTYITTTGLWMGIKLPASANLPADTYRGTLYLVAQAF